eukprot:TRINITY_DN19043_c0_g1_i1.p1 TRINITY_DN19043_c0_g1~~TRINITY_DN19043_c0_g1_i1.p1  ORF type:complete len:478 (+),score=67.80 TRINITY_DN19043_c0_g1_i1:70-1503(+)
MHFSLREPADLARHAQHLVVEHKRLKQKGGVGTAIMLRGLGDAFVKKTDPGFNKRVTPKIITRAFYQFTSAKVIHSELFEKLMDLAAVNIKDFRSQELHDTIKSIAHSTWKPPVPRLITLEKELTLRAATFTFQQVAEILFSLSHFKSGGNDLYCAMSKQLKDLYPLVGSHISPRDIASTLRAYATMMQKDKKLFDLLALRLSHPDIRNSLSVHQGSRILWSFAMLSLKEHDVVKQVADRCLTVLRQSETSGLGSTSISPLMWSAATAGDNNPLILEASRCCSLSDINSWKCSSMLWSLAHSGIDIYDPSTPHVLIFVERLVEEISKFNSYTAQTCATIAWSLASLRFKNEKVYGDMLNFLKENNWFHFSKYSDTSLVDLISSFAECGVDIAEMQLAVAERIHKTTNGKVMVKFARVLATTKASNSRKIFHMVSQWSRKANLSSDISVEDQSTLLWAACALDVDRRLQEYLTELVSG